MPHPAEYIPYILPASLCFGRNAVKHHHFHWLCELVNFLGSVAFTTRSPLDIFCDDLTCVTLPEVY